MKNGIDVSQWQGNIDWKNVNTGFCIIRAGYGRVISQKDPKFEEYYNGCKSKGIPCGVYWYSYAKTPAEAAIEADVCLQVIKGKQFEYPIYFDVEEQSLFNTGRANTSAVIRAFLSKVESAGYYVGLYMSASPLNTYVENDIKTRYAIWVAHYGVSKPSYSGAYGIWQKSGTGRVNGINGDVDLDESYVDYPTVIKNAGLNGFPKPATKPATTTNNTTTTAQPVTKDVEIKIGNDVYVGKLTKKQ